MGLVDRVGVGPVQAGDTPPLTSATTYTEPGVRQAVGNTPAIL